ncbi:RteC domain-containing protein [Flavobacterium hydrocarbonoxydans]|uniref:RteC domain-containing protein n=1 Tax=Flavobacterium hydrocarbonoxydans TaxID=2683249 RepID=UPI001E5B7BF6|nr:RteC domain-containing protein [Flavobacterium hydrocarbonoxydans]
MEKYYNECVQKLEEKIKELTLEVDDPILLPQEVIVLIVDCLSKLKEFVLKRGFKNKQEEIYFFKKLKPVILSKLIYYNAIYKIETKKPYGNGKTIKKYIDNELAKLKRFFDNNLEFYKYYRTNSIYLDERYFVRGGYDVRLSIDTYYFETDHNFTTSHDYVMNAWRRRWNICMFASSKTKKYTVQLIPFLLYAAAVGSSRCAEKSRFVQPKLYRSSRKNVKSIDFVPNCCFGRTCRCL